MDYYPAFQVALNWRNNGVSCIPCSWNTKLPFVRWGKYKNELPAVQQLENWFGIVRTNLAIVTGGITNIVVLDFDNYALYRKWVISKPQYRNSYTVATPRPGRHVYFRTLSGHDSKLGLVEGLDIKANGGYVLSYPSYSKSKPYSIEIGNDIQTISSIDDALLDDWVIERKRLDRPRINSVERNSTSGINEIKYRYPIYDVISQYTNLRSTSNDGRWHIGKCPAHPDNGPSLRVDTQAQKCYCWSDRCRLHRVSGCDVIDFYAVMNEVSNLDAMIALGYTQQSIEPDTNIYVACTARDGV